MKIIVAIVIWSGKKFINENVLKTYKFISYNKTNI